MKTVLALTLAGVLGIMQPLAVYAASPDAAGGSTVVENTVTGNTGTAAESTETEDTDTATGVTATGNTDTAAEDTVSQDEVSGNFAGAQDFEEAIEDGETEEGVVSDEASNFDFGFGFQMMYFNQFAGEATTLITQLFNIIGEASDDEFFQDFISVIEFIAFGVSPFGQQGSAMIQAQLENLTKICEEILTQVVEMEAELNANDAAIVSKIQGLSAQAEYINMNNIWAEDVKGLEDDVTGLSEVIGTYEKYSSAAIEFNKNYGSLDDDNASKIAARKNLEKGAKADYENALLKMYRNYATELGTTDEDKAKMLTTDVLNRKLGALLDSMTDKLTHTTKKSTTYVDAAAAVANKYMSFSPEQYTFVKDQLDKQSLYIAKILLIYQDVVYRQWEYSEENNLDQTDLETWGRDYYTKAENFGKAISAILTGYNSYSRENEYIYAGEYKLLFPQYMRPGDVYKTDSDGKVTSELVETTMSAKSDEYYSRFGYNGGTDYISVLLSNLGTSDYYSFEPFESVKDKSDMTDRQIRNRKAQAYQRLRFNPGFGVLYQKKPYGEYLNAYRNNDTDKMIELLAEENYIIRTDADKTSKNKLRFKRAAVVKNGGVDMYYILQGRDTDDHDNGYINPCIKDMIPTKSWPQFNNDREYGGYYMLPDCDYYNLLYAGYSPDWNNGNRFGGGGRSNGANAAQTAYSKLAGLFNTGGYALNGSNPAAYLSDYIGYGSGKDIYLLFPGYGLRAVMEENRGAFSPLTAKLNISDLKKTQASGLTMESNGYDAFDKYENKWDCDWDKNEDRYAVILYNENDDYKVKVGASSSTTAASISVLDSIDSNSSASSINSTGGSVVKLRISPSDTSAEALSGMSLHLKRTFDSFGTTTDEEIISADDIGSLIKTEDKNYYEIPVAVPYVENAEYYLKSESTSTKVQGVRMLRAGSFTASGKTYDVSYNDALLTYTGNDLGSVVKGALTVTDEDGKKLHVDKVYASDTLGTGDITVQAIKLSSSGSESSESSSALLFYDEGAFSDEAEVAEALYADGSSAVDEEVRGADLSGLDISISPREVSSTGAADSDGSIVYAQFLDGNQMVKYNEEQKKLVYLKLQMPDWKKGAETATRDNLNGYKTIKVRKEDIASYSTSENRITVNFTNNLKGSITVAYKDSAGGSEEALPDTVPEDGKDSALRLPSVGFSFNDGETYYLLTGQTLPLNKKKVTESEADGVQYKETVTYTYQSSAPKTVAASGTKITAKKAGEAVITRTTKHVLSVKEADSKKWVASTPIVKEDKVTVHVEKLALKKPASILAGNYGAVRLSGFTSAGQERNYGMACYSSNPNVASVDHSGNITANSAGTAKITVYVKGKKLSTSVKVVNTQKVRKFREPVTLVPFQSVTVKDEDKEFKPSAKTVWQEKQSADEGTDEASSADEGSGSTEDTRQELKELKSKTGKVKAYYNDVVAVTPAGKITAIGTGSCTLVGTDSNGKTIEIDITVPEQKRNVTLAAGASKTLSFYGVTAKKATWQTTPVPVQPADGEATENAVSAVKDGKVTAGAKAGKGVVYCTAKSKAYKDIENLPEVTYETTVLVESPEIVASSASGNEELEFYSDGKGGYNVCLTEDGLGAKIQTSGLYHKVIFKSADTNTAFVDENGVIYPRRDNKDDKTTKVTATIGKKKLTINVTVYGYEHYEVDHDER